MISFGLKVRSVPAEQASIKDSASKPEGVPGIKIAPIVPAY